MRMICLAVAAAAGVGLAVVPVAGAWTWPAGGPVLRAFSVGADPYAGGQHRGVDIGAAAGEAVRAPVAGRVSFAGALPGYGHTVTIRVDGLAVTLLHLGDVAVARGSEVTEGQPIAVIGPTGDAEQPTPYIHLGVRHADDDHGYVDPLTFLPQRVTPATPAPAAALAPAVPAPSPPSPAAELPPEAAVPVIAVEPVTPAVPEAAPAAAPVADDVVPRNQPAAVPEDVAARAPRGGVTAHPPPSTAPRSTVAGLAQRAHERSQPRRRRSAASTQVRVPRAPAELVAPAKARPRPRRTVQRWSPSHAVRTAAPRLVSLVARADAPPAATEVDAGNRHGWVWAAVVALCALATVPAAVARAVRKRAVPATRALCPLGRRGAVASVCARRLSAPASGCRPATRPRPRPRPAVRRRPLVPA